MKLYHSDTSPYARKVMIVAHLTGLAGDIEVVPGSGTPLSPNSAVIALNPLGNIPALVTEAGTLFDSRVITRYLDAKAGAGLYPTDARQFDVLRLEAMAEGILDAALLVIYESRLRPEEIRFDPWVEGQRAKILRALDMLEAECTGWGPDFLAGQVGVAAALGYLDFRQPVGDWRPGRPTLTEWFGCVEEMPSFVATRPKG